MLRWSRLIFVLSIALAVVGYGSICRASTVPSKRCCGHPAPVKAPADCVHCGTAVAPPVDHSAPPVVPDWDVATGIATDVVERRVTFHRPVPTPAESPPATGRSPVRLL